MKSAALIAFASIALLSACAAQHPQPAEEKAQKAAEAAQAAAAASPLVQLKDRLATLEAKGFKLEEASNAVRVTMPGSLAFASGRNVLDSAAHEALDEIALALSAVAQTRVTVTGHTDSIGAARYNQSLSEARAKAVVAYLAGKGVDAGRMAAEGRGSAEPVGDNATAKGRAANRRVELLLSVQ